MKVEGRAGMMPEAPSADRFCLGSRPLGVTAISSAVARQRARALELLLSAASSDVLRRDLRFAAQEERIGSSPVSAMAASATILRQAAFLPGAGREPRRSSSPPPLFQCEGNEVPNLWMEITGNLGRRHSVSSPIYRTAKSLVPTSNRKKF